MTVTWLHTNGNGMMHTSFKAWYDACIIPATCGGYWYILTDKFGIVTRGRKPTKEEAQKKVEEIAYKKLKPWSKALGLNSN